MQCTFAQAFLSHGSSEFTLMKKRIRWPNGQSQLSHRQAVSAIHSLLFEMLFECKSRHDHHRWSWHANSIGDPQSLASTHHRNQNVDKPYVNALREVGEVVFDYKTAIAFPTFGFWAVIPPNVYGPTHCIVLTSDIQDPFCYAVHDAKSLYYSSLSQVGLRKPCCSNTPR